MYKHDVVQIVDAYPRPDEGGRQTMKINPDEMAQNLSTLVKPLGRNDRKIAIVARDDERRQCAYQRAGYETHPMNGDRPTELRQFIRNMTAQIKQSPPKHMVLVSDDPEFVYLCEAVVSHTDLAVWASASAPRELTESNYGFRPLEELLPNLKIARIDVRIDLENIFIGLVQRGWRPNLRELIQAIRQALDDLGDVVTVTGYADFDELNRHHGGPNLNWQRELTLAGGESRYVVNQHGKNTADMKIADDIRTVVEHHPGGGNAIDVIGLATMDRDFRHIVDTARSRGKKVVVLGLQGGLSRELERAASDVRYLDTFLTLAKPGGRNNERDAPSREDVAFMMRIGAWMHRNRWRFVFRDRLEQQFAEATEILHKLIAQGWLTPSSNSTVDAKEQARILEPNPNHTMAQAACYLARWIPDRVDFCLNKRGMPHVDTNFLANGMTRDRILTQMEVGQGRSEAENWLHAAASAGLVVANSQPHAQNPTKLITTWRLPEDVATEQPPGDAKAEVGSLHFDSGHFRQLLTHGLSDAELTRLLFDYFRSVHSEYEGMPKLTRIQALLEYVERCNLSDRLTAAINDVNPVLRGEPEELPTAA